MNRSLVFLAVSFLAVPALAQETAPPPPQPTAEHKILAADVGTWDATIKAYTGGPGSEPMISKGSETNEVVLGGLWVQSRFEGSFAGAKFEGRGQFGYDIDKKKYVGTWVDSMSSSLSILEGTYDDKTKTITYVGDGYSPELKAKFVQKMVTTTKPDGSRVFNLYMKFEGQKDEMKIMEITYTKRK
jgi:hypothetical protein